MKTIDLFPLGPRELSDGESVHFGLYLPKIENEGFSVAVRIIHEEDQFIQDIPPRDFPLTQTRVDPEYGAFWETTVLIRRPTGTSQDHWGSKGRYVHRYQVTRRDTGKVVDWVIDPFAREYGSGRMSAFTLGFTPYQWSSKEDTWKTPGLRDLVAYEMHLGEFDNGIEGAMARLDYLADLGVTCIELMPVSNVAETVEWGFQPIGFFGVDERFGNRRDFQQFIDMAHQRGMAVILDVVFGHTGSSFTYSYLYRELGFALNPFHAAAFGTDFGFGERTNFDTPYVEDFFYSVALHWLDCYHVDGFRFDCVPEYWDPEKMRGYHRLVYTLYQEVKGRLTQPYWSRFNGSDDTNRLMMCAEQLIHPQDAVNQTYGNCAWQSLTADAAVRVATAGDRDRGAAIEELGLRLGLDGFFRERDMGRDHLIKSAFQYIENHDKPRFVNLFGEYRNPNYHLFPVGKRENWWMVQPYLIALLLAPGVPMLWQGQELCENNSLPGNGEGRVGLLRPVHWEYFYDEPGSRLLSLVRKLLTIRSSYEEFRRGEYYFVNEASLRDASLLVYRRTLGSDESVVAINFGSADRTVPVYLTHPGTYKEQLHGNDTVVVAPNKPSQLTIPKNYGRIWRL